MYFCIFSTIILQSYKAILRFPHYIKSDSLAHSLSHDPSSNESHKHITIPAPSHDSFIASLFTSIPQHLLPPCPSLPNRACCHPATTHDCTSKLGNYIRRGCANEGSRSGWWWGDSGSLEKIKERDGLNKIRLKRRWEFWFVVIIFFVEIWMK